jgi:crotonobetainyl-CoA:carnitine CoA-transferase CaiB-like acyl-CoA transferase
MKSRELEAGLMEAGVPCALVNNFQEVFEHPQIVARGVVQEIEHPRLGTMKVTRNPVLLDHDGPDIARPAPMLGEHSEEILRELGYDQAAIGTLVSTGVTKLAAAAQPKVAAAE